MTEYTSPDQTFSRLEIHRELFLDTRLEETGIPFDNISLTRGLGETGICGFHLQHGARHATPPRTLQPILDQTDEIVAKTLERHNRDALLSEPATPASYYIFSPHMLRIVGSLTASVIGKWSRTLLTQGQEPLLPDRRRYKYANGQLSEAQQQAEAYAKAAIVETGAAVMDVSGQLGYNITSPNTQQKVSNIVSGRGPVFLRQWLSGDILTAWLTAQERQDEQEAWRAFATKSILLDALTKDVVNPLEALQKIKRVQDRLSTTAIAQRAGWPAERVAKEIPPAARKQLAKRIDPLEALDSLIGRLDAVSVDRICEYTGWELEKVETIFSVLQRRKIALERTDPVRESVMAIARAYDFLEDTPRLARFLGKSVAFTETNFTPTIRRSIAKQMRAVIPEPGPKKSSEVQQLKNVKSAVLETADRLRLLRSPTKFGTLLGWTPKQIKDRILEATIVYFATKGGDFSESIHEFSQGVAEFSDDRVAKLLGIPVSTAQKEVSWSLRQRCLIDYGDSYRTLRRWWAGEQTIGSSRRRVE